MAKLYYPPSTNGLQKSLAADLNTGVTASMTLNNTTNIQNKPGVCVVDRVDSSGALKSTSVREFISYAGTSGATLVTLVRNVDNSSSDQDHATGAVVEFIPDVLWGQAVIDALSNVVDPTTLAVDTTKVVTPTGASTLTNKIISGATLTGVIQNNAINFGGTFATQPVFSGKPVFSRGQLTPFMTLTDASIMYLDFSQATKWLATIVPSGSRTFLATNATLGSVGLLRVMYASSASLALGILNSAASISSVRWPGGTLPTPTATVNKGDEFGFVMWDPTTFDAVIVGQNF